MVAGALVVVVAAALTVLVVPARIMPQSPVACTAEAKLCPDGSYVGRTGPTCAFSPCPSTGTIVPTGSGVHGTVMLGPTCPVERIPPDPACADKPYATTVSAFRVSDPSHAVATTQSNQSGAFSLKLSPGTYTLSAGGSGILPRCDHPQVTVPANAYATASISCDTGIR